MKKEESKKINPLSLHDIPGLGPVKLKALEKEGFTTTLQLICKSPTFLKDVTGMDKDQAGKAFKFMKKQLSDAGILAKPEQTATELLKLRRQIRRVSTGCKSIDGLLNGGIECGSITEFYGHQGSGKTQIAHTLAVQVQRPIGDGGLLEEDAKPPIVLYIDTEDTCRPERFISILAGKGLIADVRADLKQKVLDGKLLTPEENKDYKDALKQQDSEAGKYLDHIEVQKATNAYAQFLMVQNAMHLCEHANIKLIILDSGTALFRSDYLGRGNTKAKFDLLNEMIHDLKMIAVNYKIPVVFVNQIYNSPEQSFGKDDDIPYGGNIIGHAIPYRMKLEKYIKNHKMTIMKSPYQPNDETKFRVTEEGVVDAD